MLVVHFGMKELEKVVNEAVETANEVQADQGEDIKTDQDNQESDSSSEQKWRFLKKSKVVAEQELNVVEEEDKG